MTKWLIIAGAVLATGIAAPAAAQVQMGPQLSWGDDSDLGIGLRAQVDFGSFMKQNQSAVSRMTGVVRLDYFFPGCPSGVDCSYIELNADVQYPLDFGTGFEPYVGGGLNFAHASNEVDVPFVGTVSDSHSDVGLNVLGGARFAIGHFTAFGEGRIELGGGEQFVLTFGVLLAQL